jgi:hypothetical protein
VLDRSEVRALLRAERRAFREAICAGNEGALKRVRDTSDNGMAVIGAVRALETLNEEGANRAAGAPLAPGLVIVITGPEAPRPAIDGNRAGQGELLAGRVALTQEITTVAARCDPESA